MPFFQCAELHGYIKPLLELLKGLKTGRYDKGNAHKKSYYLSRVESVKMHWIVKVSLKTFILSQKSILNKGYFELSLLFLSFHHRMLKKCVKVSTKILSNLKENKKKIRFCDTEDWSNLNDLIV